jgi:cytochrome c
MKKMIVSLAIVSILGACGGGDKTQAGNTPTKSATEEKNEVSTDISSNPDYQKGLALIAKSDCLTCHKVDEKIIGPTYRDVANKYENTADNIKLLGGKIIKGGSGVWGDAIMTPHTSLSQEDAEAMAKYILLLKK